MDNKTKANYREAKAHIDRLLFAVEDLMNVSEIGSEEKIKEVKDRASAELLYVDTLVDRLLKEV